MEVVNISYLAALLRTFSQYRQEHLLRFNRISLQPIALRLSMAAQLVVSNQ